MKNGKRYAESVKAYDRSKNIRRGRGDGHRHRHGAREVRRDDRTARPPRRRSPPGRPAGPRRARAAQRHGQEQEGPRHRKGERADAAAAAGADYVGAEEMVQKIQTENWFDFDVVITTPDMMGVVGRIGKLLGPKGLMPNPKSGTVTMDVAKAIAEVKAGKVEYRLDKTAIIHCRSARRASAKRNLRRTSPR